MIIGDKMKFIKAICNQFNIKDSNMNIKKIIGCVGMVITFGLVVTSCHKDDYYIDTGLHKAEYNGTVMDYLEQNQYHLFDSLCKVIRLAGMEDVFKNDSITFFAPADTCILSSVAYLNAQLLLKGKDTITGLDQLPASFWEKELSMYLFKGVHRLKDYPQIDPLAMQVYGGQYYSSYGGKVMNIGVQFNDVNGVKYAGYRQLMLGYFSGETPPDFLPYLIPVASSDINPFNGIVHVLQYTRVVTLTNTDSDETNQLVLPVYFGFEPYEFVQNALAAGIDYSK